jgi:hypothetical protein
VLQEFGILNFPKKGQPEKGRQLQPSLVVDIGASMEVGLLLVELKHRPRNLVGAEVEQVEE